MKVARCGASARTAHSQTRITRHPCFSANCVDRWSRSALRRIFSAHSAALGPVHGLLRPWSGQACQKHPSTKTTSPRRGRTKSGVQPLAMCGCSRKRPPAAWIAFRNWSSGDVLVFRRLERCRPFDVLTHLSTQTKVARGSRTFSCSWICRPPDLQQQLAATTAPASVVGRALERPRQHKQRLATVPPDTLQADG